MPSYASTLIFMGIGGWMLGMRNMIGTISTDYISYAKSRGISNKKIMFNYAEMQFTCCNKFWNGIRFCIKRSYSN